MINILDRNTLFAQLYTQQQMRFNTVNRKNYAQIKKIDEPQQQGRVSVFSNVTKHIKYFSSIILNQKVLSLLFQGILTYSLTIISILLFSIMIGIAILFGINRAISSYHINNLSSDDNLLIFYFLIQVIIYPILFVLIQHILLKDIFFETDLMNPYLTILGNESIEIIKQKINDYEKYCNIDANKKNIYKNNIYYLLIKELMRRYDSIANDMVDSIDPVYLHSNFFKSHDDTISDINQVSLMIIHRFLAILKTVIVPIGSQIFILLIFNIFFIFYEPTKTEEDVHSVYNINQIMLYAYTLNKTQLFFNTIRYLLFFFKILILTIFYFFNSDAKDSISDNVKQIINNYETIFFVNSKPGAKKFFNNTINTRNNYKIKQIFLICSLFLIHMSVLILIYYYNKDFIYNSLINFYGLVSSMAIDYLQWFIGITIFISLITGNINNIVFKITNILLYYLYTNTFDTTLLNVLKSINIISCIIFLVKDIVIDESHIDNVKTFVKILHIPLRDIQPIDQDMEINKIIFQNTHLGYVKENNIVNNINFQIQQGELMILTGLSGSGKSTILKGIMGGVYCNSGKILFSNQSNIINSTLINNSYKNNIFAYCPQKITIPTGTIRKFFQKHCPLITDKQIYNILDKVSLLQTIKEKPQGLNTDMGNNGDIFSGGQKSRLYLAAMLSKQYIIQGTLFVILDETLDSVDNKTTNDIISILVQQLQEKKIAVICISHRINEIIDACVKNNIAYGNLEIKNSTSKYSFHSDHLRTDVYNINLLKNIIDSNNKSEKINSYHITTQGDK